MLLFMLAGVSAFYILQRLLYRRYWKRGLGIEIEFESRAVYEGDTAYLREEITNDKRMPLPALEVNLAMDRALKFSGEAKDNANVTDQSYRRDIFSLFVRQKVIRRLPFFCEKRGFYEITKADVIGYDFSFQRSFHDNREFGTSMYVYPRLADSRRIALLCRAVSGMVATQNRLFPDPFQFCGIREYHPADPMHQINWKASSKGQGLLVNQFDSATNIRMKLILDTQDFGIVRRDKLNEEGIRIAASLASRLVKERMEVTVTGNGMKPVRLKEGAGRIQELYEELARIDIYRQTEAICTVLEREKRRLLPDVVYAAVSMNEDEETAQAVASLAEKGNSVLWIIPVFPESHGAQMERSDRDLGENVFRSGSFDAEQMQGVTVFRWEMEG